MVSVNAVAAMSIVPIGVPGWEPGKVRMLHAFPGETSDAKLSRSGTSRHTLTAPAAGKRLTTPLGKLESTMGGVVSGGVVSGGGSSTGGSSTGVAPGASAAGAVGATVGTTGASVAPAPMVPTPFMTVGGPSGAETPVSGAISGGLAGVLLGPVGSVPSVAVAVLTGSLPHATIRQQPERRCPSRSEGPFDRRPPCIIPRWSCGRSTALLVVVIGCDTPVARAR